ncbi:FUSC family protein [Dictyobacter kobayashii]|uniref:Uncharacterized protein n=1 Tax=Dictyobacter kobayashii TaxID=2014872 RepID=A0A402AXH6_9CHLR|nr:FUSC family protein [Dictyobacter kobayashii]GCE23806.1 hypothetical protein KDK_76060 [Dictyobacter kobayashii]
MNRIYKSSNAIFKHITHNLILDRSAIINGIRVTAITVIPILLGLQLHQYDMGVMCFLGGLYVVLADVGGLYRSRAFAMGSATIGVALAAFVATISGSILWLAVPLMFLCAFCFGMLGIFGNTGSKVGFVVIGIFIIVLGQPASLGVAEGRLAAFIVGGLWAMLLTLCLWPLQPHQPVRQAISDYYQALSTFLSQACGKMAEQGDTTARWNQGVARERALVLAAHDVAHSTMLTFRSARQGASPIGQRFFLLTLTADRLFDASIALAEGIEIARAQTRVTHIQILLDESVQYVAQVVSNFADTVRAGQSLDMDVLQQDLHWLEEHEVSLRETLPRLIDDYAALVSMRNVIRLLKTVVEEVRAAGGYLCEFNDGGSSASAVKQSSPTFKSWERQWLANTKIHWELFKDNMTTRSLVYRHSLRLAISTALAVTIYMSFNITHGFWIPLTILFILKPDFGGTRKRANQRLFGTVLGGVIAALVAGAIHNELVLIGLLIFIGFYAFSLLNGDYGAFVAFLTLFVVLMLNISMPGDWVVACIRIMNTVLGGLISIAAGYLISPQWERERLPVQLARTIAANREYFQYVLAAYMGQPGSHEQIHQASKKAHLENANAAAAFQRMLGEPRTKQGDVERFYALVTYNQHFSDRITTLATYLHSLSGNNHRLPGLDSFTQQTEQALQAIEEAVLSGHHLSQFDSLEESLKFVQGSLQTLLMLRTNELAEQQIDTPNREAVRDFLLMGSQLDRLTHDISAMSRI